MQNESTRKTWMFWGSFLDQKISKNRNSELVNVELVAELRSNFRLESAVSYSHTQLPPLEWRMLFSSSMSVEVNADVKTH